MLAFLLFAIILPIVSFVLYEFTLRKHSDLDKQGHTEYSVEKQSSAVANRASPVSDKPTAEEPTTQVTSNSTAHSNVNNILIAYATSSQTSLQLAHKLFNELTKALAAKRELHKDDTGTTVIPTVKILECRVPSSSETRPSACFTADMLLDETSPYQCIVFIGSTYTDGAPPPTSELFYSMLKDASEDHRFPRNTLSKKKLFYFGLGDVAYGQHFNTFMKSMVTFCSALGAPASPLPPVYATSSKVNTLFVMFCSSLVKLINDDRLVFYADGSVESVRKRKIARAAKKKEERDEEDRVQAQHYESSDDESADKEEDVEDVEDIVDWENIAAGIDDSGENGKPTLLYPTLEKNLSKQGYQLIGSHSAVKLCRWTKHHLRNNGGCYKHTFYNISSSSCMEATPSLACANKCIFCWRHQTNPVARSFIWQEDDAEEIVRGAMEKHEKLIKGMRGVPGVTEESLRHAMRIRHCALSLVGEPIMYPQINKFVKILHDKQISSFMVTNAQFPEEIRRLLPVTQFYLSIDAPTEAELKRIDRPLFEDFWERCILSIRELKVKKQRTVFRLTLMNEYNFYQGTPDSAAGEPIDEEEQQRRQELHRLYRQNLENYADLIEMGVPDFIEVKGVTYCGTGNNTKDKSKQLFTMKKHVPRHDQVIQFCEDLCEVLAARSDRININFKYCSSSSTSGTALRAAPDEMPPYSVACEHEHSCCVLISSKKFYFNDQWNTWIDYDKFYELVDNFYRVNGITLDNILEKVNSNDGSYEADFDSMSYCCPAPSWAIYKSAEKGFNPTHVRLLGKKPRPGVGC